MYACKKVMFGNLLKSVDGNQGILVNKKEFLCHFERFWIYRKEIREQFKIKQHWIDKATDLIITVIHIIHYLTTIYKSENYVCVCVCLFLIGLKKY